jgi:beta-glucosidase
VLATWELETLRSGSFGGHHRCVRWPEGFLWGTGASSTQCEGAAPASDWFDWESAGRAPRSGDGNGFAARYAQDFEIYAALGLRHHRLSIEWARIEPEEGEHDHAAIAHYRAVLEAAREAGIVPWVCLHHFTLPRWFAAKGGFLIETNRTETWARHVDFVAETFGDLAGGWKPVNETNLYATIAYRGRGWPPGHNDHDEAAIVDEAIHLATAEAAVRLHQTGAPVSCVFALSPIVAQDDTDATASLAQLLDDYLWRPCIELYRDGVLRIGTRPPVERPDLAGAFDVFGFSYYDALGVAQGRMTLHPPSAPISPLGYAIWADGLELVLDRLHAELPRTPLLVAEYGIGTDDDNQRSEYLKRGLDIVHRAVERRIDVRGFFHWTGVDNYEWLHGSDVAFGIIDRDRNPRPSAHILTREAIGPRP